MFRKADEAREWFVEHDPEGVAFQSGDDDPETQALVALDARKLPHGSERTEALKRAGKRRNSADMLGIIAKTGGPRKDAYSKTNNMRTLSYWPTRCLALD
jgi:hypothetical protein